MSEQIESFKEVKEIRKTENLSNLTEVTETIKSLYLHRYKVKKITEYQYRISNLESDIQIDLFPVNLKYHNIKTGKRGFFEKDIMLLRLFLQKQFK